MSENCLCVYCGEKSFRECPALFEDIKQDSAGEIIECACFKEMEVRNEK